MDAKLSHPNPPRPICVKAAWGRHSDSELCDPPVAEHGEELWRDLAGADLETRQASLRACRSPARQSAGAIKMRSLAARDPIGKRASFRGATGRGTTPAFLRTLLIDTLAVW